MTLQPGQCSPLPRSDRRAIVRLLSTLAVIVTIVSCCCPLTSLAEHPGGVSKNPQRPGKPARFNWFNWARHSEKGNKENQEGVETWTGFAKERHEAVQGGRQRTHQVTSGFPRSISSTRSLNSDRGSVGHSRKGPAAGKSTGSFTRAQKATGESQGDTAACDDGNTSNCTTPNPSSADAIGNNDVTSGRSDASKVLLETSATVSTPTAPQQMPSSPKAETSPTTTTTTNVPTSPGSIQTAASPAQTSTETSPTSSALASTPEASVPPVSEDHLPSTGVINWATFAETSSHTLSTSVAASDGAPVSSGTEITSPESQYTGSALSSSPLSSITDITSPESQYTGSALSSSSVSTATDITSPESQYTGSALINTV
uniref:Uncharacterized protein n=1 Tax=Petromyzon marinus TaxID=7757 RepID=A0AAJ7TUW6_PETMA|nr:putative protein TPRXL [Petromyzon marinus]